MKEWIVPIAAILAIVAIVLYATSQGIDGAFMSIGVATVAGIAGYIIPKRAKGGK